jgi:hypothetical protein
VILAMMLPKFVTVLKLYFIGIVVSI